VFWVAVSYEDVAEIAGDDRRFSSLRSATEPAFTGSSSRARKPIRDSASCRSRSTRRCPPSCAPFCIRTSSSRGG
jgi:hypothetical protein